MKHTLSQWSTALKNHSHSWTNVLVLGTALGCLVAVGYLYSQTVLSFKVAPVVVGPVNLRNAYPAEIIADSIDLRVSVTPAGIKDGIWQTSDETASYLESSARPAEGNNIVIYGHNRPGLFASLYRIKVGHIITLVSAENQTYEYVVNDIKIVDPAEIKVVMPTDHEVLTVYTCTGLFDSKRLVVKAYPRQVSSL